MYGIDTIAASNEKAVEKKCEPARSKKIAKNEEAATS
jgi:hypothetical protein